MTPRKVVAGRVKQDSKLIQKMKEKHDGVAAKGGKRWVQVPVDHDRSKCTASLGRPRAPTILVMLTCACAPG